MSEVVASQMKLEQFSHFSKKKWLDIFARDQFNQFMQIGLPTRKNEWWKYTEIKENLIPKNGGARRELKDSESISTFSNHAVVFVNGYFVETLSNIKNLPKEVTLCTIDQALTTQEERIKPYLLQEFDGQKNPFAKLNSALMTDGLFLEIPSNVTIEKPIHLIFISIQQNEFMTSPRNIIIANKNSRVTLIEDHVAKRAERYFTNVVTDIYVNENARVDYCKIQDEHVSATHVANVFVRQKKDSRVKTVFLSKGARLEREDLNVFQTEPGAETDMQGLYLLTQDNQHIDHHIHVDHLASNGASSMLYKGILEKKSRAVFNGKVHVHPAIKQINAHQENHNLLLSNDAEVNTKPELEIYSEDVKCTHGATVGQLNSEPLFYLLSRGIEKSEAQRMLTNAFLEEVYSKIKDESMRQYLCNRMKNHDE